MVLNVTTLEFDGLVNHSVFLRFNQMVRNAFHMQNKFYDFKTLMGLYVGFEDHGILESSLVLKQVQKRMVSWKGQQVVFFFLSNLFVHYTIQFYCTSNQRALRTGTTAGT